MKVLVAGSRGMLGQDLLACLDCAGVHAAGVDLPEFNITQARNVHFHVSGQKPNIVINCAAYTAVDKAESEPHAAFAVNRDGTAKLAKVCDEFGVPLIHISTDYVFDGYAMRPYSEWDPVNPLSVYGQSKWEGEEAIRAHLAEHLIIRTSWLFGAKGHSFVKTVLRLAGEQNELKVVADQHGCPTWTGHLCNALIEIMQRIGLDRNAIPWGTYHFCGHGRTTWHGLAKAIVEDSRPRQDQRFVHVIPITTSEYPTAAKRPRWSVLDCRKIRKTFSVQVKPWREGLRVMLNEHFGLNRHSRRDGR